MAGGRASSYPECGTTAPDFALPAADGTTVRLSEFIGRKSVVLFFYPRDMTSGCTKEACSFRDRHADLVAAGVEVLGISPDPPRQHQKFIAKHALNFALLSDAEHQAAEAYGVWQLKSLYGREYMGLARTTFVIDRQGCIARAFAKVKPEGHAEEVLAWLRDAGGK